MTSERRKEPRHVVVGIEASLNDVPSTIIDISPSGVRLVRPADFPTEDVVLLTFQLAGAGRSKPRSYDVEGRLVRATAVEMTYSYAPPAPRWAAVLRAHDTFAQTALQRI